MPIPTPGPRPSGWVRILEDNKDTRGRRLQSRWRGIRPAMGGNKENDVHSHLGTFTIRCGGSRHVAIVHSPVVLHQSPWLRDEVERKADPEAPVRTPGYIRWWQVAWALEYMYTGTVPGFQILAGEDLQARYPGDMARSIGWGLTELWDVAHFFGLGGLKRQAEAAFREYFSTAIRHAILVHRGALPSSPGDGGLGSAEELVRPETRVGYEFYQSAWKIFGNLEDPEVDYIDSLVTGGRSLHSIPIAQDENALQAWESTIFNTAGAPDDEGFVPEHRAFFGPTPRSSITFRHVMLDLCMRFATSGLFELSWFQSLILEYGPQALRIALRERMDKPDARWPRDEYPWAPFSFERVDPWRLVASNARVVPHSAQQQGPVAQQ